MKKSNKKKTDKNKKNIKNRQKNCKNKRENCKNTDIRIQNETTDSKNKAAENHISKNNGMSTQIVENNVDSKVQKAMTIWYTNADVLTQEKLRELKDDINSSASPPDIIAVTELKPKMYTRELLEVEYMIDGYSFEHEKLSDKSPTRGIGVYVRDKIRYRRTEKKPSGAEKEEAPSEVISIEIDLTNGEQMNLVVLYRSPHSNDAENMAINKLFKSFPESPSRNQVVLGDFNRKEIDWEVLSSPSNDDNAFIEAIRDSYMTQHILQPTRGRGTDEPSTLDLLFTSKEEAIEDLKLEAPLGKSDHSLVKFTYRYEAQQLSTKTVFNYSKGDYVKMQRLLDIDWEDYFSDCCDDIDLLWEKFHQKFKAVESECVPTKKVGVGKNKRCFALDRKCLKKRKKKYRLWKRYLESKDAKDYHEYCKVRNQVRRMTRNAVLDRERNVAAQAKSNSKTFWRFINSKTKLRSSMSDLFISEKQNIKATTDEEKAGVLAEFFSSVFVKEPDWIWQFEDEQRPTIKQPLVLNITQEDVQKRLNSLKTNKSPGPDNIHPRTLKETAPVISKPLEIIFNESLRQGRLPTAWKEASITAIYKKKGNKHLATNYRPVSLTCVVCKIMEKFIRDAALDFLQNNNILTNKQYGFIKGCSTTLQLLTIMDKWTEILERGGEVDAVYFDFQKAFDTVPHKRLVELMQHYQIDATVVTWISDFLTSRKQHVHLNGVKSSVFDVVSGVPQGSVLGPLLFLIYINSMVEKVDSSGLFLFADDLKFFKEVSCQEDENYMQQVIDSMQDWTQYALLKFHPKKCKAMHITSTQRKTRNPHYSIGDTQITHVSSIEDLGITFNDRLSFEEHIHKKVNKANALAGMIRRSFVHLDKDMFKSLFVTIVRPHLEYGATLWNPLQKRLINVVENVQRRASKRLPGMSDLTYRERLKCLDLPTLEYRRYRGDMIEMYKLFHDLYDRSTSQLLKESLEKKAPRQSHRNHQFTIYKVPCQKPERRSFFKVRATDQWNNLPAYIVEAPSLNSFKNRLDNFWKHDDIMYNSEVDLHALTSARGVRYREVEGDDS